MNESDRDHLAAWVDEHLEAYVDGELSRAERLRIEAFLEADACAARSADLARRVRRELAMTERPGCPPSVARAVLAQARAESEAAERTPKTASPKRLKTAADRPPAAPAAPVPSLPRRAAWRADDFEKGWRSRMRTAWAELAGPSLAVGALVLLVVASAVIGRPPSGSDAGPTHAEIAAAGATPAEVDQALQDAKWALHYVSDIGRRTGRSIREEVLRERVTEPVQRAVGSALDTDPNS